MQNEIDIEWILKENWNLVKKNPLKSASILGEEFLNKHYYFEVNFF